jgi:biofilm PGA synthesis N-glycosyltransferase PgaC
MSNHRVAIVTPALDEEANLPRLVAAMTVQTLTPVAWTIVDTGSTDATVEIARAAAREHDWIHVVELEATTHERGAPIVRAVECAALTHEAAPPDFLINVDADVSFGEDFLARLAAAFDDDDRLGIASGTCFEQDADGAWSERFVTGSSAWGATRAYRWACFCDVTPLTPRLGWDGIDELRAQARSWGTRTLRDLPFRHHRREGARDAGWRGYTAQGSTAHFMGYRASYLLLRSLHSAIGRPLALAMVAGYVRSALERRPRLDDAEARAYLARQQRLRTVGRRFREARGRATP